MSEYIVTLSVPTTGGPVYRFRVEAGSEDAAVDVAFEEAFATYPQFGIFQIVSVQDA